MAFVNDYLTNEEKEVFKQKAIPTGVFWKGGILGYDPYSKVKCTLDRDKHIYLFDLERHHDAEYLDEHNFRLVWDALSGNEAILISARKRFLSESIPGNGCDILWHSFNLGLPKNLKSEKAIIIDKFKEALIVFELNGNPRWKKTNRIIKFDF
jgi:hypothetical protein